MPRHRTISKCLLLTTIGIICTLITYVSLSIGFVDIVLITRNRSDMLNRVEKASSSSPPNVEFLARALSRPDWRVAAVAAERIGQLQKTGQLEREQASVVLESLFKMLASSGHWWRFGWDRDEPEFEQFRGSAIEAAAEFGPQVYSSLRAAASSENSFEKEAACWIVLSMLKKEAVDRSVLVEQGIYERVEYLAQNDTNRGVQAACGDVYATVNSKDFKD